MGVIGITMFLGISWLATHIDGTVASDERSLPGQIAYAVFDGGLGFYVVQFFTAAILILAANTAYQDFPRLSSILARDRFMPSQFMNRGDRLVFSNGIVVLAAASLAPDLRLRCEPDPSDPAVRDRRVHLVHALADRDGGALATAEPGRSGTAADGVVRSRSTWSARR